MTQEEPLRIVALREAVEFCLKSGLSESEVLAITTAEVYGAARLREAIRECLMPPKPVKLNFYQYAVDRVLTAEDILAAVNQAVGGVKT